jgi:NADH:ubiquinone oxidoreductase subunit K
MLNHIFNIYLFQQNQHIKQETYIFTGLRKLSSLEEYYLTFILLLFCISCFGLVHNSTNILVFICYLELGILSSYLLMILASIWCTSKEFQIYALLLLIIGAIDAALGLSIITLNSKIIKSK